MMQGYAPIHDTVPIAVRIAVAIDAIICTTHLKVSFFVIMVRFFTIHYSLFTLHFKSVSFTRNGRATSVSAATATRLRVVTTCGL